VQTKNLPPRMAELLTVAYGNMVSGHEHGPGQGH
jgi:hypothetical protein